MYQRVIVAIDGSSTSTRALRAATKLAREEQSVLRIVHVVDLVAPYTDTPYDLSEYEASVRKAGEQVLKHASAIAQKAGIKYETSLPEVRRRRDRVADILAREAERWRADLIMIGTHGRRGVSHLFLGSVAESLARIAPTPVLLIRGR